MKILIFWTNFPNKPNSVTVGYVRARAGKTKTYPDIKFFFVKSIYNAMIYFNALMKTLISRNFCVKHCDEKLRFMQFYQLFMHTV